MVIIYYFTQRVKYSFSTIGGLSPLPEAGDLGGGSAFANTA